MSLPWRRLTSKRSLKSEFEQPVSIQKGDLTRKLSVITPLWVK
jgi:hypothetical protein